jgi:uncharacterized protein (DUF4415 family)
MAKSAVRNVRDPEMAEFEAALLRSVDQAKAGQFARVNTPEMIATARARGRPLGSTKEDAKKAVTIRYAPEVLAAFRATGQGWQARMNDVLVEAVRKRRVKGRVV